MPDEHELASLRLEVDREQGRLDYWRESLPAYLRAKLSDEDERKFSDEEVNAHTCLKAAKLRLATAEAAASKAARLQVEEDTRRTIEANQRMADAAESAAWASADAARWAKWAAIFTAIAAVASLVAPFLQRGR